MSDPPKPEDLPTSAPDARTLQDQPRRTVALKVIKPGLAGPELLRASRDTGNTARLAEWEGTPGTLGTPLV